MAWRVAESLEKLRAQIDALAPKRSTLSDGAIGDTDHTKRTSDHNPHCGAPHDPTVTARDFTHDPENGADMHEIAEAIRVSRDGRVKYVIWDKRMFSSYKTSTHTAWTWRPYSGPNLHTVHMHVSVQCAPSKDSTRPWKITKGDWLSMATKEEVRAIVREEVQKEGKRLQRELAVGKAQKAYDPDKVNLKKLLGG